MRLKTPSGSSSMRNKRRRTEAREGERCAGEEGFIQRDMCICEEIGFKYQKLIFNPLLGARNRAIRGESIIICQKL